MENSQAAQANGAPIVYAAHVGALKQRAILEGVRPIVTTNPNLLEQQAKEKMDAVGFRFIQEGTGESASVEANRRAFRKWQLVPRVLVPTTPRDLSVVLFGEKYDTPLLMAPIGSQGVIHPDKEIGVASACNALRVPFILSTGSSTGMGELASAVPGLPKWFQLYWLSDDELTISLLSRAKHNGFQVLVLTLDNWASSWRPNELDAGDARVLVGYNSGIGMSDPVFLRMFAEMTDGQTPSESQTRADVFWAGKALPGFSRAWEDLAFLKKHWDGPIVLKGILTAEDALLAAHHGMDGIVVSNHGGRQVDGSYGTLDVLPEIVDAVGDKLTVLVDSGFRTGADIVKGLALGAKAVLVGRPVVYGLGIDGRRGAEAVLAGLLADLDTTMGYLGARTIADLKPSTLRRAEGGW